MKKLLILTVALVVLACSKSNNKNGNVELTGKVEGLKQGKLYIQQLKDTSLVILDTITIDGDSEFQTKFQIDEPQMLYVFLDRGNTTSIDNSIHIFAEPGKMTLNTTLKEFFASAKITGSKNQVLYENFVKIKSKLNNENLDLTEKEIKNTLAKKEEANIEIAAKKDKLKIRRYLATANFALVNSKYEVSPYITLTEIPDAHIKLLDTINQTLSPKIAKSKYGKELAKWVKERKEME